MGRTRDQVVDYLFVALAAANQTQRSASLALGLNHSYLNQFMKKTGYSPDVLPENVRIALARLLDIDEELIKVSDPAPLVVKTLEGKTTQNGEPGKESGDRRSVQMRVDNILQEIGRIKERLDRLEAAHDTDRPDKPKTTTRP